MADSDASCPPAEDPGVEVPPSESPDRSSPAATPDVSTDVAPTRRARRRPDPKPAAEEPETPKAEEQPAATSSESSESSVSTVAPGGWGYWGSWGKSLLSTATATVTSVGQGLTQAIEKAETSLGIPSPGELSAQAEDEQQRAGERAEAGEPDGAAHGAMGMFSSLSSVVQSTGKTVISGGLDALEFIGKKTMDVIAESDPGFRKTKGLMVRNATLSQVLREAKEREELQTAETDASRLDGKAAAHYGVLFDEFQGLAHLEALELLSRESEAKVKSVLTTLSGDELLRLREELDRIRDSFSLADFDEEDVDERKDADGSEFQEELLEAMEGLKVSATAAKLSAACRSSCSLIADMSRQDEEEEEEEEQQDTHSVEEVHAAAIRSLAELTARSIELFHKLAQTVLFSGGAADAAVLTRLTVLLCREISLLSRKFTSCLTAAGSREKADVLNPLLTGVFLEASNSASYVQDAFQLLRPVLEIAHIQRTAEDQQQS